MATDIKLDQVDGTFVEIEARVVKASSSDFMLDSAGRRTGGGPFRRAMVHDSNDGLSINFAGDYPGGVTISGVAELQPQQLGLFPVLVVRGGISYEIQGVKATGGTTTIVVNLDAEIARLQGEISALTARVAALEARP